MLLSNLILKEGLNTEGFEKSEVRQHQRRTKTGKMSTVKRYSTKRVSKKDFYKMTMKEAIEFGASVKILMRARNKALSRAYQNREDSKFKKAEKKFSKRRNEVINKFGIKTERYNQGRGLDSQQIAERLTDRQIKIYHIRAINEAIKKGKTIPNKVLKDYSK